MIEIRNVSFGYQANTEIKFPDFIGKSGETHLILGKSGVGKTTLLHLMALLLKPKSGQIIINNTDVTDLKNKDLATFRAKNIGIIFQKSYFVAALTVAENIQLANYLANIPFHKNQLETLAKSLDFVHLLHKKTHELSIGEQQRVAIARAIINNPRIILADEPSSSLDDENCRSVIDLLQNQAKNIGACLIIVTHDQRLKNEFVHQITL